MWRIKNSSSIERISSKTNPKKVSTDALSEEVFPIILQLYEFEIWKATNQEQYLQLFACLVYELSNFRDPIRIWFIYKTVCNLLKSTQNLIENFKSSVSEKDELDYQDFPRLIELSSLLLNRNSIFDLLDNFPYIQKLSFCSQWRAFAWHL